MKPNEGVLPQSLHPDCIETAQTYLRHFDVKIEIAPVDLQLGTLDLAQLGKMVGKDTAAVVVQAQRCWTTHRTIIK